MAKVRARNAFRDPETAALAILDRLGIPRSKGAVQSLVGWSAAEGGHFANDARFNILNTTLSKPGATAMNSVGVKAYVSPRQGLEATVDTLSLPAYRGIRQALRDGDPDEFVRAVGASPWGTNGDLIARTVASTRIGSVPRAAGRPPSTRQGSTGPRQASPAGGTRSAAPVVTPGSSNDGAELRRSAALDLISGKTDLLGFALQQGRAQQADAMGVLDGATVTRGTGGIDPSAFIPQSSAGAGAGRAAAGGALEAVAWAQRKHAKGITESAGPNRSPWIDKLESGFGLQGQAWCAMFTSVAVTKGGAPDEARTTYVGDVRKWAGEKSHGYKGFVAQRNGRGGDLVLWGDDHIVMIEKADPKRGGYWIIGGNDSDQVNRRFIAYGDGDIVRPDYPAKGRASRR